MLISTDHVMLISTACAEHDNAMDKTGAAASRPARCGQEHCSFSAKLAKGWSAHINITGVAEIIGEQIKCR